MKTTTHKLKMLMMIAGALGIAALNTGCSSMNTVSNGDSFVFGKIFAMQDALQEAAKNCNDTTRSRAQAWAAIGFEDLSQSTAYMDKGSDEYLHTSALVSHLSAVSRRTKDTGKTCAQIKVATSATDQYLVAIKATMPTVAMR